MLQQTRVEAVIPYYERFLARFPAIEDLARAREADLLSAWSGLGYYSRARNLQQTAQAIVRDGFPGTHDELLRLKGIGPYTAAAIASICFDEAHAAVDGNVLRVVSRLDNDGREISASATRRAFAIRAGELLDRRRPGDFNQAMMELGATVCTPRNPRCSECPVVKNCEARRAGTERQLPVKLKRSATRDIALDVVVALRGDEVLLVKRPVTEKRLGGFWELPAKSVLGGVVKKLCEFRHQIVNERYRIGVWKKRVTGALRPPRGGKWFELSGLEAVPLTTVTKKAISATLSVGDGNRNGEKRVRR